MSESRSQFGIQHNACKRDVRDKEIRRSSVASRPMSSRPSIPPYPQEEEAEKSQSGLHPSRIVRQKAETRNNLPMTKSEIEQSEQSDRDTQCPSKHHTEMLGCVSPSMIASDRENIIAGSNCIVASKVAGSKSIYKPPMKSAFAEGRKGVAKYEVGTASPDEGQSPSYVVLLVGATGAGKSTLINGIANYVLGVRWEDSFRYKVITEEQDVDQAHSQTQRVASYTIHAVHPSRFTTTIIDTPGFGEVEETNRRILIDLKQFLSVSGIDSINAVGFVTEASSARLASTQKYIFHSILSIFGKDIANSILLMATFADRKTPPVLGALQEVGATFRKCFRFNNSALYPEEDDEDDDGLDSEDAEQTNFDEMFWGLTMNGFKEFFEELFHMNSRQLNLNEREQLTLRLQGLKLQGLWTVAKIEELKEEEKIVNQHKADINAKQQFNYTVDAAKPRPVERNVESTNCTKCWFTCHENCSCPLPEDEEEVNCVSLQKHNCTVCPGKCNSRFHTRSAVKYELCIVKDERSSETLMRQYGMTPDKCDNETLVAKIREMIAARYCEMFRYIRDVQQTTARLNELSLRPNTTISSHKCIEMLIKMEEIHKEWKFNQRVKCLQFIQSEAEPFLDITVTEEEFCEKMHQRAQELSMHD